MLGFVLAVIFTLATSFWCSLLEALVLSTTTAEVEILKRDKPHRGALLEKFRQNMDETISSVLTLNTMAHTLGSVLVGALGADLFGHASLGFISGGMTFGILIFSEVIPKNLGVVYRPQLLPHVIYPLLWMQRVLYPLIWICRQVVKFVIRRKADHTKADREIILLAERGAQEGTLSRSESNIIANALSLDDVRISSIMTPRIVVTALPRTATVGEVFRDQANLPFGRMPVYGRNIDDVVGLVRRRDLLKAKAADQDAETVEKLMSDVQFVPETITVAQALQQFLKTQQKLAVVVDEFGSTVGVVSLEDIMEHLLGREIFEKDDVAVDMREFARTKSQKLAKGRRSPGGAKA